MTRSLVTGALGSGGSYMAEYLLELGEEVHGVGRWHTSPYWKEKPPFPTYVIDLTDALSVLRLFEKVRPDCVYHLASHANVRDSFDNPGAVIKNNVDCTFNILDAIRTLRDRDGYDPTILICSSSEVYGQRRPLQIADYPWIDEDCPIGPVNPYAVSKLCQDAMGFAWFKSFGLRVIRTRMFTYINPRRSDLFATSFALQVARIEAGLQSELMHGNLDSLRTMLDVRDSVRAYHLAATKCVPGEVYNIGGKSTCTVGAFLNTLIEMAKCPIPTRQDPALMRPADVTYQIPSSRKFEEATGWKPKIALKDSIADLLDHCRETVGRRAA